MADRIVNLPNTKSYYVIKSDGTRMYYDKDGNKVNDKTVWEQQVKQESGIKGRIYDGSSPIKEKLKSGRFITEDGVCYAANGVEINRAYYDKCKAKEAQETKKKEEAKKSKPQAQQPKEEQGFWSKAWSKTKSAVKGVYHAVKDSLPDDGLGGMVKSALVSTAGATKGAYRLAKSAVTDENGNFSLRAGAKKAWKATKNVFRDEMGKVSWKGAWQAVKAAGKGVLDSGLKMAKGMFANEDGSFSVGSVLKGVGVLAAFGVAIWVAAPLLAAAAGISAISAGVIIGTAIAAPLILEGLNNFFSGANKVMDTASEEDLVKAGQMAKDAVREQSEGAADVIMGEMMRRGMAKGSAKHVKSYEANLAKTSAKGNTLGAKTTYKINARSQALIKTYADGVKGVVTAPKKTYEAYKQTKEGRAQRKAFQAEIADEATTPERLQEIYEATAKDETMSPNQKQKVYKNLAERLEKEGLDDFAQTVRDQIHTKKYAQLETEIDNLGTRRKFFTRRKVGRTEVPEGKVEKIEAKIDKAVEKGQITEAQADALRSKLTEQQQSIRSYSKLKEQIADKENPLTLDEDFEADIANIKNAKQRDALMKKVQGSNLPREAKISVMQKLLDTCQSEADILDFNFRVRSRKMGLKSKDQRALQRLAYQKLQKINPKKYGKIDGLAQMVRDDAKDLKKSADKNVDVLENRSGKKHWWNKKRSVSDVEKANAKYVQEYADQHLADVVKSAQAERTAEFRAQMEEGKGLKKLDKKIEKACEKVEISEAQRDALLDELPSAKENLQGKKNYDKLAKKATKTKDIQATLDEIENARSNGEITSEQRADLLDKLSERQSKLAEKSQKAKFKELRNKVKKAQNIETMRQDIENAYLNDEISDTQYAELKDKLAKREQKLNKGRTDEAIDNFLKETEKTEAELRKDTYFDENYEEGLRKSEEIKNNPVTEEGFTELSKKVEEARNIETMRQDIENARANERITQEEYDNLMQKLTEREERLKSEGGASDEIAPTDEVAPREEVVTETPTEPVAETPAETSTVVEEPVPEVKIPELTEKFGDAQTKTFKPTLDAEGQLESFEFEGKKFTKSPKDDRLYVAEDGTEMFKWHDESGYKAFNIDKKGEPHRRIDIDGDNAIFSEEVNVSDNHGTVYRKSVRYHKGKVSSIEETRIVRDSDGQVVSQEKVLKTDSGIEGEPRIDTELDTYEYNTAGKRTKHINTKNNGKVEHKEVQEYSYDSENRLSVETETRDGVLRTQKEYSYGDSNNPKLTTKEVETRYYGDESTVYESNMTYDKNGYRTSFEYSVDGETRIKVKYSDFSESQSIISIGDEPIVNVNTYEVELPNGVQPYDIPRGTKIRYTVGENGKYTKVEINGKSYPIEEDGSFIYHDVKFSDGNYPFGNINSRVYMNTSLAGKGAKPAILKEIDGIDVAQKPKIDTYRAIFEKCNDETSLDALKAKIEEHNSKSGMFDTNGKRNKLLKDIEAKKQKLNTVEVKFEGEAPERNWLHGGATKLELVKIRQKLMERWDKKLNPEKTPQPVAPENVVPDSSQMKNTKKADQSSQRAGDDVVLPKQETKTTEFWDMGQVHTHDVTVNPDGYTIRYVTEHAEHYGFGKGDVIEIKTENGRFTKVEINGEELPIDADGCVEYNGKKYIMDSTDKNVFKEVTELDFIDDIYDVKTPDVSYAKEARASLDKAKSEYDTAVNNSNKASETFEELETTKAGRAERERLLNEYLGMHDKIVEQADYSTIDALYEQAVKDGKIKAETVENIEAEAEYTKRRAIDMATRERETKLAEMKAEALKEAEIEVPTEATDNINAAKKLIQQEKDLQQQRTQLESDIDKAWQDYRDQQYQNLTDAAQTLKIKQVKYANAVNRANAEINAGVIKPEPIKSKKPVAPENVEVEPPTYEIDPALREESLSKYNKEIDELDPNVDDFAGLDNRIDVDEFLTQADKDLLHERINNERAKINEEKTLQLETQKQNAQALEERIGRAQSAEDIVNIDQELSDKLRSKQINNTQYDDLVAKRNKKLEELQSEIQKQNAQALEERIGSAQSAEDIVNIDQELSDKLRSKQINNTQYDDLIAKRNKRLEELQPEIQKQNAQALEEKIGRAQSAEDIVNIDQELSDKLRSKQINNTQCDDLIAKRNQRLEEIKNREPKSVKNYEQMTEDELGDILDEINMHEELNTGETHPLAGSKAEIQRIYEQKRDMRVQAENKQIIDEYTQKAEDCLTENDLMDLKVEINNKYGTRTAVKKPLFNHIDELINKKKTVQAKEANKTVSEVSQTETKQPAQPAAQSARQYTTDDVIVDGTIDGYGTNAGYDLRRSLDKPGENGWNIDKDFSNTCYKYQRVRLNDGSVGTAIIQEVHGNFKGTFQRSNSNVTIIVKDAELSGAKCAQIREVIKDAIKKEDLTNLNSRVQEVLNRPEPAPAPKPAQPNPTAVDGFKKKVSDIKSTKDMDAYKTQLQNDAEFKALNEADQAEVMNFVESERNAISNYERAQQEVGQTVPDEIAPEIQKQNAQDIEQRINNVSQPAAEGEVAQAVPDRATEQPANGTPDSAFDEAFKEAVNTTDAQMVQTEMKSTSVKSLEELKSDIENGKYSKLSDAEKAQYRAEIDAKIERLQKIEAEKLESRINKAEPKDLMEIDDDLHAALDNEQISQAQYDALETMRKNKRDEVSSNAAQHVEATAPKSAWDTSSPEALDRQLALRLREMEKQKYDMDAYEALRKEIMELDIEHNVKLDLIEQLDLQEKSHRINPDPQAEVVKPTEPTSQVESDAAEGTKALRQEGNKNPSEMSIDELDELYPKTEKSFDFDADNKNMTCLKIWKDADGNVVARRVFTNEATLEPDAQGIYEVNGKKLKIENDKLVEVKEQPEFKADEPAPNQGEHIGGDVAPIKKNPKEMTNGELDMEYAHSEFESDVGDITVTKKAWFDADGNMVENRIIYEGKVVEPNAEGIYEINGKKYRFEEDGILYEVKEEVVKPAEKPSVITREDLAAEETINITSDFDKITDEAGYTEMESRIKNSRVLNDAEQADLLALLEREKGGFKPAERPPVVGDVTKSDVDGTVRPKTVGDKAKSLFGAALIKPMQAAGFTAAANEIKDLMPDKKDVKAEMPADEEVVEETNPVETVVQPEEEAPVEETPSVTEDEINNAETEEALDELKTIIESDETLSQEDKDKLIALIEARKEAIKGEEAKPVAEDEINNAETEEALDELKTRIENDTKLSQEDKDKLLAQVDKKKQELKTPAEETIDGHKVSVKPGKNGPVVVVDGKEQVVAKDGTITIGGKKYKIAQGGKLQEVVKDTKNNSNQAEFNKNTYKDRVQGETDAEGNKPEIEHSQVVEFTKAIQNAKTEEDLNNILSDIFTFKMFKGRKQLRTAIRAKRNALQNADNAEYVAKKEAKVEKKTERAIERFDDPRKSFLGIRLGKKDKAESEEQVKNETRLDVDEFGNFDGDDIFG